MQLSGCFIDLIAYVSYSFGKGGRPIPSYQAFRDDVERLIEKSETISREHDLPAEEYMQARFAVLVWVDECVMQSEWVGKSSWRKKLLQRVYYKTTAGGVEFFKKLDALESGQNDVREVFYMCMMLGYSGRFGSSKEDCEARDSLKTRCLARLTGNADNNHRQFVPQSYQNSEPLFGGRRTGYDLTVGMWWAIVLPCLCFLFLILIYSFVLSSEISSNFAGLS